ncbi:hypothetical protein FKM82_024474 [Ascaphus truei]
MSATVPSSSGCPVAANGTGCRVGILQQPYMRPQANLQKEQSPLLQKHSRHPSSFASSNRPFIRHVKTPKFILPDGLNDSIIHGHNKKDTHPALVCQSPYDGEQFSLHPVLSLMETAVMGEGALGLLPLVESEGEAAHSFIK